MKAIQRSLEIIWNEPKQGKIVQSLPKWVKMNPVTQNSEKPVTKMYKVYCSYMNPIDQNQARWSEFKRTVPKLPKLNQSCPNLQELNLCKSTKMIQNWSSWAT